MTTYKTSPMASRFGSGPHACRPKADATLGDRIIADKATPAERLEAIRASIRREDVSYGELAELASLIPHIASGDVELLEWAGVPEGVD